MKINILLMVMIIFSVPAWSSPPVAPQVVVSIKPIHSLVSGVMQGVAEPLLLIKGGGSPHGYTLRPSEARALSRADLIVWIGPQLEGFLQKPLSTLGRNARQLELVDTLKSQLLPLRENGNWGAHNHHAEAVGEEDSDHHGDINPHLWLNPLLAKKIVAQTASALVKLDPVHQQQYLKNAEQIEARLNRLHQRLLEKLAPVKTVPYVVFHDAYQYFEASYGLNAVGAIAINPERQAGVKRILAMRQKIVDLNARCVFSEPQFEPRLLATLVEGTGARTGILDPLGADLPAGVESYFLLLERLAENLRSGLQ